MGRHSLDARARLETLGAKNVEHTLHGHARALSDACGALRALFQQVHDLGGVGMPTLAYDTHIELFEGWTHATVWSNRPDLRATWPDTSNTSAHRRLAVQSVRTAWANDAAVSTQTVAACAQRLIEATFPDGVPDGTHAPQVCRLRVAIGARACVFVEWSQKGHYDTGDGLEGFGLRLPEDLDVLVDALLLARRLSMGPTPPDTAVWKVTAIVGYTGEQKCFTETTTVCAHDAADALARVALIGANAVLVPGRLRSVDIWQRHATAPADLLSTLRARNTPCTSNTPSTPT